MNSSQKKLRKNIEVGIYAAIIAVAVTMIRIPIPTVISRSMVHPGNALVVLGGLILGPWHGAIAGALGLTIFDLLNGYATSIPTVVFEAVTTVILMNMLWKALGKRENLPTIIGVTVFAAVLKATLVFIKYIFRGLIAGAVFNAALATAASSMTGSILSGVVTIILVPIFFYPMQAAYRRLHPDEFRNKNHLK